MALQITMFLSIFCLLFFIGAGVNALQCYSCTNCNDPFKSAGVSTTSCSDSCMKSKAEKDGTQVVARGCGVGKENKCQEQTVLGVKANVCTCTTDKCNGVGRMTMNVMTPLIFAAFMAVARKYLL